MPDSSLPPIDAARFAREWDGELVRAASRDLAGLSISDGTKAFLLEIGLPENGRQHLAAAWTPMTFQQLSRLQPIDPQPRFGDLWQIGALGGYPVCIEDGSGIVAYAAPHDVPDSPTRVRIWNSSVQQLASCLLLHRQFYEHHPVFDFADTTFRENALELKRQIAALDERAFRDPTGYWQTLIDELEIW